MLIVYTTVHSCFFCFFLIKCFHSRAATDHRDDSGVAAVLCYPQTSDLSSDRTTTSVLNEPLPKDDASVFTTDINEKFALESQLDILKTNQLREEDVDVLNKLYYFDKTKKYDNNWHAYQKSLPPHWIDLSGDTDVNYPSVDRKVLLDVEGIDVEKNIFDKAVYDDADNVEDTNGYETMGKKVENSRPKRAVNVTTADQPQHCQQTPRIDLIKVEKTDKEITMNEDGVPELLSGTTTVLRLFGKGISQDTLITFTQVSGICGQLCEFPATGVFKVISTLKL